MFRDISLKVRRRFPNHDAIIKAGRPIFRQNLLESLQNLIGFLQDHESIILGGDNGRTNYWMPVNWSSAILQKLFEDGNIPAAPLFNSVWQEVKTFRSNMATLCNYDWVPIPIAYPQVVFFAVRVYFFTCLFTRQHLDMEDTKTVRVLRIQNFVHIQISYLD